MKQEEEEVDIVTGRYAEEIVEYPRANGDEKDIRLVMNLMRMWVWTMDDELDNCWTQIM
jgi:hypothetical protein